MVMRKSFLASKYCNYVWDGTNLRWCPICQPQELELAVRAEQPAQELILQIIGVLVLSLLQYRVVPDLFLQANNATHNLAGEFVRMELHPSYCKWVVLSDIQRSTEDDANSR